MKITERGFKCRKEIGVQLQHLLHVLHRKPEEFAPRIVQNLKTEIKIVFTLHYYSQNSEKSLP